MNKVLIVDDDASIRMLYTDELTEEGYDVVPLGDGRQVMDMIKKEGPDLVVLDLKLKSQNGLDLLQEIRNAYYELPVILCTAYPSLKYDPKSIAADYFVVKSSNLDELKGKIRLALEAEIPFRPEIGCIEYQEERPILTEQLPLLF